MRRRSGRRRERAARGVGVSAQADAAPLALVTGGAGGIGRAIATTLIADGHRVVVADLNGDAARGVAEGLGCLAAELDVTDRGSVDAAIDGVEQEQGSIDVLVNNAGWDEFRPFLDTEEPFWDRVIEINFKGCLRLCRRVVPGMVERQHGRVINIASDAARVGSSLEAVYSGAKGGVVAFTKTLAREVARHSVTANAVCPGPTDTPMLAQMLASGGESAKVAEALRRAIPMRRLARPEDIAGAVAFFASERAGFVTGQTLSVSGGLTMA
jgi:2-hydroxycyclohexanecarboxyl-CoA dehydrogenase